MHNAKKIFIVGMIGLMATAAAAASQAATFSVSLSGDPSQFTESQFPFDGLSFDQFTLSLTGFGAPFTVMQGDEIDSTVTLTAPYTIPTAPVRTDILQFFTGSTFPSENTAVTGTFTFFDGVTPVGVFNYDSTTSNALASFAVNFSPANPAFTFTSFTNVVTITDLATPATLDGSFFEYDLVSPGVPEPGVWMLMVGGVGLAGAAMRRRRGVAAAA
jgi:hypothetical protein